MTRRRVFWRNAVCRGAGGDNQKLFNLTNAPMLMLRGEGTSQDTPRFSGSASIGPTAHLSLPRPPAKPQQPGQHVQVGSNLTAITVPAAWV